MTSARYLGAFAGKNPINDETYLPCAITPFSYFCAVPVFPFSCVAPLKSSVKSTLFCFGFLAKKRLISPL